jgi:hypothetical protein
MKFLFDDASFAFEALRAAGFANYGGADLGEILVTARAIPDGDEAQLASRVEGHRRARRGIGAKVAGRWSPCQCP